MKQVIIDIETTGLNTVYGQIVEIAAVRVSCKGIVARFQTLIWPGEDAFSLPGVEEALRIQGKTMDEFEAGEPLETAILKLQAFVGRDRLIAFNSEFEREFLKEWFPGVIHWRDCVMLKASNIMGEAGSGYCPWNDYHGNYKWPKLREAAEYFGVLYNLENGHSALHDAEVAALIWIEMKRMEKDP